MRMRGTTSVKYCFVDPVRGLLLVFCGAICAVFISDTSRRLDLRLDVPLGRFVGQVVACPEVKGISCHQPMSPACFHDSGGSTFLSMAGMM